MNEKNSMRMHTASGQWKLGFTLALVAAACWGILPIALKIVLGGMDPYTITWYRFAVAAVVLGAILAATRRIPAVSGLGARAWAMLGIAVAGLLGNYLFYLIALQHATPTVNQTVIQISPMFLLLGGLLIFHESFSLWQWAGFAVLVPGLVLFFNRRLPELTNLSGGLGLGVALLVIAALVWAAYGLAQKQLLNSFGSQQILWLLYLGSAVALLPVARISTVRDLGALQFGGLAFCCANTLIGYGAFAEALEHWEVSRVSAVLALAPLFTLGGMWLMDRIAPGILEPERLNVLSVFGALLVVGGSALCAAGKRKPVEIRGQTG